jgi:hypothetical protein
MRNEERASSLDAKDDALLAWKVVSRTVDYFKFKPVARMAMPFMNSSFRQIESTIMSIGCETDYTKETRILLGTNNNDLRY